jgi:Spy/CpxP family protein refolding chaperone
MKNGVELLGRIRAQGIAILVLTFVVGVLVGFAGERIRVRASDPLERRPRTERRFPQGDLPPMFQELNLTPEQTRQIAAIMHNGRPRTDAVLDELRAVTDSIRQEVRGVLTPEQLAVWDSLMVRMRMRRGPERERMPGRREGRGGPPQPMP